MVIKDKILNAAWELYSDFGIRSVSVDDIAKKSGVSKSAIYQEFGGKDFLTKAIVDSKLDENKESINFYFEQSKNAIEVMLDLSDYTVALFESSKPQFLFDLEKYHSDIWEYFQYKQYELTSANVLRNLKQGIEEGLYLKDLDLDFTSRLFVNMNVIAAGEKFFPATYDKRDLYFSLIKYHLRSVVTDAGREFLKQRSN